jgi:F-type H+-transporting ATPase subunit b
MGIFADLVVLAQEEEGSSGLALLIPEPAELIAGIIAFAIVFFFIWRWAVPAINRSLEQRQNAIAGQIAAAEKAKTEAEGMLADYKAQLASAKNDGNKIIDEAREAADQLKADTLTRADAEAAQIVAKAREEAQAEKSRALADARTQVGEISVDLAGRIVGESLDAEAHKDLVDRYLADLEQM